jgi:aspartyl/asparaginyl beta-hydroxylase (cupin superfamily)
MRLAPGGGELTRHSDIVDPDVGTASGKFMRLHLPLITNPEVIFQQWLLDGTRVAMHMPLGQWSYIDTRKPHTARNGGDTDRIHLVVDAAATDSLRLALLRGEQAEEVRS